MELLCTNIQNHTIAWSTMQYRLICEAPSPFGIVVCNYSTSIECTSKCSLKPPGLYCKGMRRESRADWPCVPFCRELLFYILH